MIDHYFNNQLPLIYMCVVHKSYAGIRKIIHYLV